MIYIILLLFLFIIWTILLKKGLLFNIDDKVYKLFIFKDVYTKIFKIITTFASTKFFIFISGLILILHENKVKALVIVGCFSSAILVTIMKHIIKRERPNIKRLVHEKGYSYPSGHALNGTMFYGLLISLLYFSNLDIKILLISMLVILILFIGISRIYLGVHYFSDVIGGLFLGTSYLLIYVYIMHSVLSLV